MRDSKIKESGVIYVITQPFYSEADLREGAGGARPPYFLQLLSRTTNYLI